MHVGVAELFSTLNSQLDVLTVESLLKTFVQDKGTGSVKPGKACGTRGGARGRGLVD